jgi:hypothetical protein
MVLQGTLDFSGRTIIQAWESHPRIPGKMGLVDWSMIANALILPISAMVLKLAGLPQFPSVACGASAIT